MREYWKLKEKALDRTLWRTRFGRGYGPVIRQIAERMINIDFYVLNQLLFYAKVKAFHTSNCILSSLVMVQETNYIEINMLVYTNIITE